MADLIVTGKVEDIRDLLCGPQQHNEHCKGWRWHMYLQDSAKRDAAVREWARQVIVRAKAGSEIPYAQAAE